MPRKNRSASLPDNDVSSLRQRENQPAMPPAKAIETISKRERPQIHGSHKETSSASPSVIGHSTEAVHIQHSLDMSHMFKPKKAIRHEMGVLLTNPVKPQDKLKKKKKNKMQQKPVDVMQPVEEDRQQVLEADEQRKLKDRSDMPLEEKKMSGDLNKEVLRSKEMEEEEDGYEEDEEEEEEEEEDDDKACESDTQTRLDIIRMEGEGQAQQHFDDFDSDKKLGLDSDKSLHLDIKLDKNLTLNFDKDLKLDENLGFNLKKDHSLDADLKNDSLQSTVLSFEEKRMEPMNITESPLLDKRREEINLSASAGESEGMVTEKETETETDKEKEKEKEKEEEDYLQEKKERAGEEAIPLLSDQGSHNYQTITPGDANNDSREQQQLGGREFSSGLTVDKQLNQDLAGLNLEDLSTGERLKDEEFNKENRDISSTSSIREPTTTTTTTTTEDTETAPRVRNSLQRENIQHDNIYRENRDSNKPESKHQALHQLGAPVHSADKEQGQEQEQLHPELESSKKDFLANIEEFQRMQGDQEQIKQFDEHHEVLNDLATTGTKTSESSSISTLNEQQPELLKSQRAG